MSSIIDDYIKLPRENQELIEQNHKLERENKLLHNYSQHKLIKTAAKVEHYIKKSAIFNLYKKEKYGNLSTSQNDNNQPIIQLKKEFDYDHTLFSYEFRFLNYYRGKNIISHLQPQMFKVPYVKGLVSVILPVYNGEDYLKIAIDSILNQSYKKFELIIVDDGSTDLSGTIADKYKLQDARVQVIHQSNLKLPSALSKGFRSAKGEFYTWTSADNILYPDFLSSMVQEMNNHPEIGLMYSDMNLIDQDGNFITDYGWYTLDKDHPEKVCFPQCLLELNTHANNHIGAGFMYRAQCAYIVGDYSSIRFGIEDYDYWMRINEIFHVRHVSFNKPQYAYRLHRKSLSAHDKELKITEDRYKLMLWDEFRRDYFQKPIYWIINDNEESLISKEIKGEILKHHQFIFDQIDKSSTNNYDRKIEITFYNSQNKVSNISKIKFKSTNAFKVLVTDKVIVTDDNYDMMIVYNKDQIKNCKLNGFKGWYIVKNPDELYALIDNKARSKMLSTIERESFHPEKEYDYKFTTIITYHGNKDDLNQCLASLQIKDNEIEILCNSNQYRDLISNISYSGQIKYVVTDSEDDVTKKNIASQLSNGEFLVYLEDNCTLNNGREYYNRIKQVFEFDPHICSVIGETQMDHEFNDPSLNKLLGKYLINQDKVYQYNDQDIPGCYAFSMRHGMFNLIGGFYHINYKYPESFCMNALFGAAMQLYNNGYHIFLADRCKLTRHIDKTILDNSNLIRMLMNEIFSNYQLKILDVLPYNIWPEVLAYDISNDKKQASCSEWNDIVIECKEKLLEQVRNDFNVKVSRKKYRDYFTRLDKLENIF